MSYTRSAPRVALGALALTAVLGSMVTFGTRPAQADGALDYQVDPATAAEGVFSRFGPHVNDTQLIVGYGVYPNQTVQLLCGVTDGDPVGPFANTTWHYVADLDNPGEGNFWLNDHYVDSPNSAGYLAPGEDTCQNETGNPMLTDNSNHTTTIPSDSQLPSVFFSGGYGPHGSYGTQVATQDIGPGDLPSRQNCSDAALLNEVIAGPSTLAGWSYGRYGVVSYLADAGSARVNAVQTITFIDPGAYSDMAGACDTTQFNPNKLLVQLLAANPQLHILIVTGKDSEDRPGFHRDFGTPTFGGLWHFYLAGIWQWDHTPGNADIGQQVLVCDYNFAGHEELLQDLGEVVQYPGASADVPATDCPVSPYLPQPVEWQP